jgi:hypothetical protein
MPIRAWMLEGNYNGHAAHPVTILNGIKQLAGPNIEVTYAAGCPLGAARGRIEQTRSGKPLPTPSPRPVR